eukprot:355077-Chlamydomonas_euryale.AAC.4
MGRRRRRSGQARPAPQPALPPLLLLLLLLVHVRPALARPAHAWPFAAAVLAPHGGRVAAASDARRDAADVDGVGDGAATAAAPLGGAVPLPQLAQPSHLSDSDDYYAETHPLASSPEATGAARGGGVGGGGGGGRRGRRSLLAADGCYSEGLVAGLAVLANVGWILAIALGLYAWHLRQM